jgi:hypothetical protein
MTPSKSLALAGRDLHEPLERYAAAPADWAFAQRFVDWNDIEHGIQQVDACRTRDGSSCSSSWRTSTRTSRSTSSTTPTGTPP